MSTYNLGIDIGGTFTDAVLVDSETGRMWFGKALTTPDDPGDGAVAAMSQVMQAADVGNGELVLCVHGTTLVINTLIERRGARTALLTTTGFRDTLDIARESTYDVDDHAITMPAPLVARSDRHEIDERVTAAGVIVHDLDPGRLRETISALGEREIEAVAIVFLHAYRHPVHERAAARAVADLLPGVAVSVSHVVAPVQREYERTVTTAANAYVQPVARRYLPQLEQRLREAGLAGELTLMTSSGGVSSVPAAIERPITLVESGPAGGAFIAGFLGGLAGSRQVLAFDMGGTTAKAALVENGRPLISNELEVDRTDRFRPGSGLPLRVSSIDLIEIGAGGGSIARINELGLLQVGPRSAGAVPGPASYGRGGVEPTVTDAAVVLGYIGASSFLGGEMALDPEAAEASVRDHLTDALRCDVPTAAYAVHDLVTEEMANAARAYVAEHGLDHRSVTLVATGGAGPVHAYSVARKLGIGRVLIGLGSGVASALGLLVAPPEAERLRGLTVDVTDADAPALIAEIYDEMRQEIVEELKALGIAEDAITWQAYGDLRYAGQGSEVTVPLPASGLDEMTPAALAAAFTEAYAGLYGRTLDGVDVEGVAWRLRGSAGGADRALGDALRQRAGRDARDPVTGTRPVYFAASGGYVETPVLARDRLSAGYRAEGPLVIEERESTIVVGPDAGVLVDDVGNVVIELGTEARR